MRKEALKIACIGGGPAGLYFALLMKKQNPDHDITVYERNRAGDTFGWGVVFSDQTLENLAVADEPSKKEIIESLAHWDDIDVHFKGRCITSGGHGFCGIERKHLLQILQSRCDELGVNLAYEHEVGSYKDFPDADLIIASDGIFSRTRAELEDKFQPQIEVRANRFTWLGTKKLFEAFTFIFVETEWGWFQAHAYRFNDDTSTFIIETREETWKAAGIDEMSQEEGIEFCERIFEPWLDGNKLMTNATHLKGSAMWINFHRVHNPTWVHDNVVLMGDAAHTAHFSIGSGTKLAMEDAISLAGYFQDMPDAEISEVLAAYQAEREIDVVRIQSAARNSTEWFENVELYAGMEPEQFAYSLLTRSQRVSHENLRVRDESYLADMERWFFQKSGGNTQDPVPMMFAPYKLRDMDLANRVVVSPMAMYSAPNGLVGDFHLTHLGSRAVGGAGLVFTEMTAPSLDARITPRCAGIWNAEQADAWARIVDFVHTNSNAKICLQLGHSGPKGSTRIGWEGMDLPLERGNWELMAPSAIPWSDKNDTPRSMTREDMERVIDEFAKAAVRAHDAGFDMLELHAAHGYLFSAFISPLTNQRTDEYGGSLENRVRFPLEVFCAMRRSFPSEKPISVRISANDWHLDGTTPEDAVKIARAFMEHGVDVIDVSAGQTSTESKPVYGRMFQTPFSDKIRNTLNIPTIAVGNIYETDHVNSILGAGRADLVALARPHLSDPYWTLHAAAELGYDGAEWPKQYHAGRDQYVRNLERAGQMVDQI